METHAKTLTHERRRWYHPMTYQTQNGSSLGRATNELASALGLQTRPSLPEYRSKIRLNGHKEGRRAKEVTCSARKNQGAQVV